MTLLVLSATLTEQLWAVIWVYIIIIWFLVIYQYIRHQSDYKIFILITLLCVGIIGSMTRIHNYYAHQYPDKDFLISTGIIIEKWIGKYTLQLDDQSQWIYYSKRDYDLWDQIMTFSTYKPWYTGDMWHTSWKSLTWSRPTIITSGREYHFDYNKYQLMKWLQGTLYETQAIPLWIDQWGVLLRRKKTLQHQIIDTYGSNRITALILGMLIGDKSLLTKSDYQQFIDTGLVHMIAVSGWNIAILSWFLMIILFFLPYYIRITVIAIVVVVYCLICGMDSSVMRAMVMWLLSIGALMMGRLTAIWKILSLTWIMMLLYNPYFLIYDLWFCFSFWAVTGMIIVSESWKLSPSRRSPIVQNIVFPSIGATIGVMPLMIFAMGKLNVTGIIGNLFVTPVISIVMIYGYISTYLYQLLWRSSIKTIQEYAVGYIYWISDLIQDYSLIMNVSGWWMKILFLISMVVILIRYHSQSSHNTKFKS